MAAWSHYFDALAHKATKARHLWVKYATTKTSTWTASGDAEEMGVLRFSEP
jgi:hypothetical protein